MPQTQFEERLSTIGDTFSDFTFICNEKIFAVHRIILHCHCETFNDTLGPDEKVRILDNEDLDAFEAMLEYFYKGIYDAPVSTEALSFHVRVFEIASRFSAPGLKAHAQHLLRETLNWGEFDMVQFAKMADRLDKIVGVEGVQTMKKDAMEVLEIASRDMDMVDSGEFKDFVREHVEWAIELFAAKAKSDSQLQDWSKSAPLPVSHPKSLDSGTAVGGRGLASQGFCRIM